ncbi:unnamed protein product [Sphagnum balticum]
MKGREDIGYKFRLRDKEGTVVGYAWFTKNNWWYQEHPEALWHLVKIPCYEMDLFSEHVDQDGKELYEGDECQFYEQTMPFIKRKEEANLYSVITGIMPMKPELSQWSNEKFVEAYRFCKLFVTPDKKRWTFTKENVTAVIARYMESDINVFFKEFLYRINDSDTVVFRLRLVKFIRIVGLFLRRTPAFISEEIENEVKEYPAFAWILEGYETKKLKMGTEILVQKQMDNTQAGTNVPIKAKSPEQQYMEATARAVSIFNELAKSVTPGQLKKMKIEKRLDMIPKYMGALASVIKANKGQSKVFLTLNTDAESRQSLEERLLKYAEEQQQDSD